MKKIKKIAALFLCLAMILALAACGGGAPVRNIQRLNSRRFFRRPCRRWNDSDGRRYE